MQKWGYALIRVPKDLDVPVLEEQLEDLGQRGWELVTVVELPGCFLHYFKRPVEETEGEVGDERA